jgi:hypothetical protein
MATEADQAVREWARKNGRLGGKARLVKMSAEERHRIAKLAAQARWAKQAGGPDSPDGGPERPIKGGATSIMLSSRRTPRRVASLSLPLFELEAHLAA